VHGDVVTLFLCGDVMLGRGVDQILPHPGNPVLHEAAITDARSYVRLAEHANGPIPRPVDASWPWGEALQVLDDAAPEARVINLETSVTGSDDFAPGKAVHYRMHPDNLDALSVARPDVCVLANNHVLDLGEDGLEETLDALARAGLPTAGAGGDLEAARRPAVVPLVGGGRLLVFAAGAASSGIPARWAASEQQPGVHFVAETSPTAADGIIELVDAHRRAGDLVVVSIHWGSNWGYDVPRSHVGFARRLVDGGVDIVHGHSSHHPRPIEVYRDKLILYGCGDLIDDYEGISGYERYRDDLRLLYLITVARDTGTIAQARIVPMLARRMRLERAGDEDVEWLRATLDRISQPFGARLDRDADGSLTV
jgi:poly-gamma-glutamate capsule biosynthesis protein CapA/YwtB (metallophosphatase superfamily)